MIIGISFLVSCGGSGGGGGSSQSPVKVFFTGNDGSGTGFEVWVYDPVRDEMTLSADVNSQPGETSVPRCCFEFSGRQYFIGNDGLSGYELWSTDGTPQGTALVADINAGPDGSSSWPADFVSFNGQLFFSAAHGTGTIDYGRELMVYDPTNGFSMAADIYPGSKGSDPRFLTVYNDSLFFSGKSSVYSTDDSIDLLAYHPSIGPYRAADISYNTVVTTLLLYLTVYNDRLFFGAEDGPGNGIELWDYHPMTAAGMVADIWPGPGSSVPTFLTVFEEKLYFSASSATANTSYIGPELFAYDPIDGVTMVADIWPGTAGSTSNYGSHPTYLTVLNDKLYFSAFNLQVGGELWSYNSAEGAKLVADIYPSFSGSLPSSSSPRLGWISGGKLYFGATDGVHGYELWVHDPSNNTTRMVKDLNPGPSNGLWNPAAN